MLAHVEKGGSFREVQLNNSGDSDGIPIGLKKYIMKNNKDKNKSGG